MVVSHRYGRKRCAAHPTRKEKEKRKILLGFKEKGKILLGFS
jgi:hypothetical protein